MTATIAVYWNWVGRQNFLLTVLDIIQPNCLNNFWIENNWIIVWIIPHWGIIQIKCCLLNCQKDKMVKIKWLFYFRNHIFRKPQ